MPSPIDVTEFDALLELLERQTMRDVITMFVRAAPARFAVARDGIAAGEGTAVATAFHTLRSGCGQLGASALEQACADGERRAKEGDLPAALALLGTAEREFARCVSWFEEQGWLGA